ncbi:hypothetical protein Tco_0199030 [Tanacetum coccineum]
MESERYLLNYLGLEVGSIRRIKVLDTAYWGFLAVGTTLDIFQNIILIPYFEYGVLSLSRYDVLSYIPLWSLELQMFKMFDSSDEVCESAEMMKGMQVDDMQKASRLLLMARECEANKCITVCAPPGSLSRDLFAEGALGSVVVATTELSFSVGCSSEGWRGIVETIVSAMVSMTSGGCVPVKSVFQS